MKILDDLKKKFRHGSTLNRLVLINVAVFVLVNIYLLVLYLMNQNPSEYFGSDLLLGASSDFSMLIRRPWTLVTHMFTHIEFGHFLFNLITLYFMGQLFEQIAGSAKLWQVYVTGGIFGFLFFALSHNFLPRFHGVSVALGASAAVMAISVAAAVLRPHQPIHIYGVFRIELRWMVLILVLLDLASIRSGSNSGGHIGHLGGAFFGFLFAQQLQKGRDITKWLDRIRIWLKSLFSPRKMKVTSRTAANVADEQFNYEKRQRQKRVDEILDKIGRSGYDALSREEKDFLFRNSQK